MELYQLGKYNSREGLSKQAAEIRDFVKENFDFISIRNFISQFKVLEQESVIILEKAILAGYWTSYSGFGWSKEQEIQFWELVYEKRHPQSSVAILTLAECYRGNKVKSLSDVIDLYFNAIEINLEHYYSLTQEGGEELDKLLENKVFRKKCLLVELSTWENLHDYSLEEIDEETPYILKRCNGDKNLESIIKSRIEELIQEKKTSNTV